MNLSIEQLEHRINMLKSRQERLLDLKIDASINNDVFLFKNNQIDADIFELSEQKKKLSSKNVTEITQRVIELSSGLYDAYCKASDRVKAMVIKSCGIELFINHKKELKIEDSPLFKSSKMLVFLFGTPEKFDY
ncbi:hypothetical protein DXX93_18720 [Thalassotalea euphylliae]|uniref:Uncharacterized protein n=1 Tax=Thalassotalea euphylliae TaxID=1655234 RepID=A0A3E0TWM6_9GAMM|nr:hypothetical protein [Thalassotalea euphylliae]REL28395.1 hypothetical protein DXX93_18720 [Thalassotalea euphylliae]